jgi:mannose-6-phosphate isomerase
MNKSEKNQEDRRPWGFYQVLSDEPDHKIKRIVIHPNQRLSYQRHSRRSEHWYIVTGEAIVTKNDDEIKLKAGQAIDIPTGTWHRIMNARLDDLIFIEIQTGVYFGEDDIERKEDDYGRL